MKRNLRQASKYDKPKKDVRAQHAQASFSHDESLDDLFRFDDKLVGKRTNVIFQPVATRDGFYDLNIDSALNSSCSLPSKSFYDVEFYSEMDQRKNQKMVKYIENIDLDASNLTFSDLDDATNSVINATKLDQSILKNEKAHDFVPSMNLNDNSQKKKEIPTIEKKNQSKEGQVEKDIDKQKSTTSRKDVLHIITDKKGRIPQKVASKNADDVKIQEKPVNKQLEKNENIKKQKRNQQIRQQINQMKIDGDVQNKKKKQPENIFRRAVNTNTSVQNNRSAINSSQQARSVVSQAREEKLKRQRSLETKRQQQKLKRQRIEQVSSQEQDSEFQPDKVENLMRKKERIERSNMLIDQSMSIYDVPKRRQNRKRVPDMSDMDQFVRQDLFCRKSMFTVTVKPEYYLRNGPYEPFVTFGQGKYPVRIRVPPLRRWQNERKNYSNGELQSFTLVNDRYGRNIEKHLLRVQRMFD